MGQFTRDGTHLQASLAQRGAEAGGARGDEAGVGMAAGGLVEGDDEEEDAFTVHHSPHAGGGGILLGHRPPGAGSRSDDGAGYSTHGGCAGVEADSIGSWSDPSDDDEEMGTAAAPRRHSRASRTTGTSGEAGLGREGGGGGRPEGSRGPGREGERSGGGRPRLGQGEGDDDDESRGGRRDMDVLMFASSEEEDDDGMGVADQSNTSRRGRFDRIRISSEDAELREFDAYEEEDTDWVTAEEADSEWNGSFPLEDDELFACDVLEREEPFQGDLRERDATDSLTNMPFAFRTTMRRRRLSSSRLQSLPLSRSRWTPLSQSEETLLAPADVPRQAPAPSRNENVGLHNSAGPRGRRERDGESDADGDFPSLRLVLTVEGRRMERRGFDGGQAANRAEVFAQTQTAYSLPAGRSAFSGETRVFSVVERYQQVTERQGNSQRVHAADLEGLSGDLAFPASPDSFRRGDESPESGGGLQRRRRELQRWRRQLGLFDDAPDPAFRSGLRGRRRQERREADGEALEERRWRFEHTETGDRGRTVSRRSGAFLGSGPSSFSLGSSSDESGSEAFSFDSEEEALSDGAVVVARILPPLYSHSLGGEAESVTPPGRRAARDELGVAARPHACSDGSMASLSSFGSAFPRSLSSHFCRLSSGTQDSGNLFGLSNSSTSRLDFHASNSGGLPDLDWLPLSSAEGYVSGDHSLDSFVPRTGLTTSLATVPSFATKSSFQDSSLLPPSSSSCSSASLASQSTSRLGGGEHEQRSPVSSQGLSHASPRTPRQNAQPLLARRDHEAAEALNGDAGREAELWDASETGAAAGVPEVVSEAWKGRPGLRFDGEACRRNGGDGDEDKTLCCSVCALPLCAGPTVCGEMLAASQRQYRRRQRRLRSGLRRRRCMQDCERQRWREARKEDGAESRDDRYELGVISDASQTGSRAFVIGASDSNSRWLLASSAALSPAPRTWVVRRRPRCRSSLDVESSALKPRRAQEEDAEGSEGMPSSRISCRASPLEGPTSCALAANGWAQHTAQTNGDAVDGRAREESEAFGETAKSKTRLRKLEATRKFGELRNSQTASLRPLPESSVPEWNLFRPKALSGKDVFLPWASFRELSSLPLPSRKAASILLPSFSTQVPLSVAREDLTPQLLLETRRAASDGETQSTVCCSPRLRRGVWRTRLLGEEARVDTGTSETVGVRIDGAATNGAAVDGVSPGAEEIDQAWRQAVSKRGEGGNADRLRDTIPKETATRGDMELKTSNASLESLCVTCRCRGFRALGVETAVVSDGVRGKLGENEKRFRPWWLRDSCWRPQVGLVRSAALRVFDEDIGKGRQHPSERNPLLLPRFASVARRLRRSLRSHRFFSKSEESGAVQRSSDRVTSASFLLPQLPRCLSSIYLPRRRSRLSAHISSLSSDSTGQWSLLSVNRQPAAGPERESQEAGGSQDRRFSPELRSESLAAHPRVSPRSVVSVSNAGRDSSVGVWRRVYLEAQEEALLLRLAPFLGGNPVSLSNSWPGARAFYAANDVPTDLELSSLGEVRCPRCGKTLKKIEGSGFEGKWRCDGLDENGFCVANLTDYRLWSAAARHRCHSDDFDYCQACFEYKARLNARKLQWLSTNSSRLLWPAQPPACPAGPFLWQRGLEAPLSKKQRREAEEAKRRMRSLLTSARARADSVEASEKRGREPRKRSKESHTLRHRTNRGDARRRDRTGDPSEKQPADTEEEQGRNLDPRRKLRPCYRPAHGGENRERREKGSVSFHRSSASSSSSSCSSGVSCSGGWIPERLPPVQSPQACTESWIRQATQLVARSGRHRSSTGNGEEVSLPDGVVLLIPSRLPYVPPPPCNPVLLTGFSTSAPGFPESLAPQLQRLGCTFLLPLFFKNFETLRIHGSRIAASSVSFDLEAAGEVGEAGGGEQSSKTPSGPGLLTPLRVSDAHAPHPAQPGKPDASAQLGAKASSASPHLTVMLVAEEAVWPLVIQGRFGGPQGDCSSIPHLKKDVADHTNCETDGVLLSCFQNGRWQGAARREETLGDSGDGANRGQGDFLCGPFNRQMEAEGDGKWFIDVHKAQRDPQHYKGTVGYNGSVGYWNLDTDIPGYLAPTFLAVSGHACTPEVRNKGILFVSSLQRHLEIFLPADQNELEEQMRFLSEAAETEGLLPSRSGPGERSEESPPEGEDEEGRRTRGETRWRNDSGLENPSASRKEGTFEGNDCERNSETERERQETRGMAPSARPTKGKSKIGDEERKNESTGRNASSESFSGLGNRTCLASAASSSGDTSPLRLCATCESMKKKAASSGYASATKEPPVAMSSWTSPSGLSVEEEDEYLALKTWEASVNPLTAALLPVDALQRQQMSAAVRCYQWETALQSQNALVQLWLLHPTLALKSWPLVLRFIYDAVRSRPSMHRVLVELLLAVVKAAAIEAGRRSEDLTTDSTSSEDDDADESQETADEHEEQEGGFVCASLLDRGRQPPRWRAKAAKPAFARAQVPLFSCPSLSPSSVSFPQKRVQKGAWEVNAIASHVASLALLHMAAIGLLDRHSAEQAEAYRVYRACRQQQLSLQLVSASSTPSLGAESFAFPEGGELEDLTQRLQLGGAPGPFVSLGLSRSPAGDAPGFRASALERRREAKDETRVSLSQMFKAQEERDAIARASRQQRQQRMEEGDENSTSPLFPESRVYAGIAYGVQRPWATECRDIFALVPKTVGPTNSSSPSSEGIAWLDDRGADNGASVGEQVEAERDKREAVEASNWPWVAPMEQRPRLPVAYDPFQEFSDGNASQGGASQLKYLNPSLLVDCLHSESRHPYCATERGPNLKTHVGIEEYILSRCGDAGGRSRGPCGDRGLGAKKAGDVGRPEKANKNANGEAKEQVERMRQTQSTELDTRDREQEEKRKIFVDIAMDPGFDWARGFLIRFSRMSCTRPGDSLRFYAHTDENVCLAACSGPSERPWSSPVFLPGFRFSYAFHPFGLNSACVPLPNPMCGSSAPGLWMSPDCTPLEFSSPANDPRAEDVTAARGAQLAALDRTFLGRSFDVSGSAANRELRAGEAPPSRATYTPYAYPSLPSRELQEIPANGRERSEAGTAAGEREQARRRELRDAPSEATLGTSRGRRQVAQALEARPRRGGDAGGAGRRRRALSGSSGSKSRRGSLGRARETEDSSANATMWGWTFAWPTRERTGTKETVVWGFQTLAGGRRLGGRAIEEKRKPSSRCKLPSSLTSSSRPSTSPSFDGFSKMWADTQKSGQKLPSAAETSASRKKRPRRNMREKKTQKVQRRLRDEGLPRRETSSHTEGKSARRGRQRQKAEGVKKDSWTAMLKGEKKE
ncbi:HECT-domain (ubiquitin-transferase) domain protein [Toxoplasma gondii RUB]|uniref:HECT-domain (Ubiquitin-transferase) domain protein n=1 Tax=Toxoplasma gondii RUB TaxID=935652 RepID=A0A086LL51_TOXGO|nr:HECT-domain (ubiquitin-transferase) domain protein [Toxoplasma gondii RUB]